METVYPGGVVKFSIEYLHGGKVSPAASNLPPTGAHNSATERITDDLSNLLIGSVRQSQTDSVNVASSF